MTATITTPRAFIRATIENLILRVCWHFYGSRLSSVIVATTLDEACKPGPCRPRIELAKLAAGCDQFGSTLGKAVGRAERQKPEVEMFVWRAEGHPTEWVAS